MIFSKKEFFQFEIFRNYETSIFVSWLISKIFGQNTRLKGLTPDNLGNFGFYAYFTVAQCRTRID